HFFFRPAVSADRSGRGGDRVFHDTTARSTDGREDSWTVAAGGDRHRRRAGAVVGAGGPGRAPPGQGSRVRRHRRVLFEARGGEFRRRVRAARLHGAAGGGNVRLDERAGDGGRARPRRDAARAADQGDAV